VAQITELSAQIGQGFDKDTIHDFRTSVKTLRAFLRLLNTQTPGLKLPASFKKLYFISGNIRDTQLQLKRFSTTNEDLIQYSEQLNSNLEQYKKDWNKCYSKKTLRKLNKRLSNFKYKTLSEDFMLDFFKGRLSAIYDLAQETMPTDEQIHYTRKRIKDILYTSKLAGTKYEEEAKKHRR